MNHGLDRAWRGAGQRLRVRVEAEERGRYGIDAGIGRLRGQDCGDGKFEGARVGELCMCAGMLALDEIEDMPDVNGCLNELVPRPCSSRRCCRTRSTRASVPAWLQSDSAQTGPGQQSWLEPAPERHARLPLP